MKASKSILCLLVLLSHAASSSARDTFTPQIRKVSAVQARAREVAKQYANQKLISHGILDVTLEPYSADNTGVKDVTAVLQQAIIDARDAQLVCYLPAGTYLVSAGNSWREASISSKLTSPSRVP